MALRDGRIPQSRTRSVARSAMAIVGAFVLPPVMVGMMDASTTAGRR
jgi:hypothetical protein